MPINAIEAARCGSAPRQHGALEFSQQPVGLDTARLYRLGRIRRKRRKRESRDHAGILLSIRWKKIGFNPHFPNEPPI